MALLTSKSHRFVRSQSYSLPEYQPAGPRVHKNRISLVLPAWHERRSNKRPARANARG